MPTISQNNTNLSIKEVVKFDRFNLQFPESCPPSLIGILSDLEYVTIIKMINDERPNLFKKIKKSQNILTVWLIFSFTIGILIAPFVKISLHKQKKAILHFWEKVNILLSKSNSELFEERFLRWTLKKSELKEIEEMDVWNPHYCYHLEIVYDPPRVTAALEFVNMASIALGSDPQQPQQHLFKDPILSASASSNTASLLSTEDIFDIENSVVEQENNSEQNLEKENQKEKEKENQNEKEKEKENQNQNENQKENQKEKENQNQNENQKENQKEKENQNQNEMERKERKEKRRERRETLLNSLKMERKELEEEREVARARLRELRVKTLISPSFELRLPPLPLQMQTSPSNSIKSFITASSMSEGSILVPQNKINKY